MNYILILKESLAFDTVHLCVEFLQLK